MDLPEYLQNLYEYHYWANSRTLVAAASMTSEQFYHPQGHSWGSVHGVLLHMTNAEWIWLRRCQGESPKSFPGPDDFPSLTAIQKRWTGLEREMRTFINNQATQSLLSDVVYTNTQGDSFRLCLWQILVHIPNHATHHRGELAAMFAAMGISHDEEDWLHFSRRKVNR